jgi:hypothetical protein
VCGKLKLALNVGLGMLAGPLRFVLILCIILDATDPVVDHACMLAAKQQQVPVCTALVLDWTASLFRSLML